MNFSIFPTPCDQKREREGGWYLPESDVSCLVRTDTFLVLSTKNFIHQPWLNQKENAAKTRCQNKFVIHLLREPGSGLVTIMQSSAVQFSAYMGHGTHPKYRLHFCGWVTYTFFSCVFLNCQLSWLISTLSHVLELRNDILWIKCWDFSPFLHCKCIIWCLGWWDRINWYQPKVLLIRIHS